MQLAPQIELAISCSDGGDTSGLIFGMRVSAGTKNPYHIIFPKTDSRGRASLEAAAVLGQFKDHWEGLMDFNGTLESASQTASFFLFDIEALEANLRTALAWPLLTHEKTLWTSRAEKVDYLLSCRNNQYCFSETTLVIPTNGQLRFAVARR